MILKFIMIGRKHIRLKFCQMLFHGNIHRTICWKVRGSIIAANILQ